MTRKYVKVQVEPVWSNNSVYQAVSVGTVVSKSCPAKLYIYICMYLNHWKFFTEVTDYCLMTDRMCFLVNICERQLMIGKTSYVANGEHSICKRLPLKKTVQ